MRQVYFGSSCLVSVTSLRKWHYACIIRLLNHSEVRWWFRLCCGQIMDLLQPRTLLRILRLSNLSAMLTLLALLGRIMPAMSSLNHPKAGRRYPVLASQRGQSRGTPAKPDVGGQ